MGMGFITILDGKMPLLSIPVPIDKVSPKAAAFCYRGGKMSRTSNPGFQDGTLNSYNIQQNEVRLGDRFGYKIIVIIREDGVYAYRGPTNWSDQKVAEEGDEVSWEYVMNLFPTIDSAIEEGKWKPSNWEIGDKVLVTGNYPAAELCGKIGLLVDRDRGDGFTVKFEKFGTCLHDGYRYPMHMYRSEDGKCAWIPAEYLAFFAPRQEMK